MNSITADSERDAARILQLQGLFVTRLLPAWRKNARISLKKSHPKFVVSFFRQTAVMLKAGITLSGAMEALLRQKQTEKEKEVISGMYRSIRAGGTLASAMKAYPAWFPKSAAAVVHAGEESGNLDRLLAKIADVMGRQYDMKEKRMKYAADKLQNTSLSIFDIASSIGFSNQGRFAKVFHDYYKLRPLEYRRNHSS